MPILFRYLFLTGLRYELAMFFGFALLMIGQQVIAILDSLPNIELWHLGYLVLLIMPDAVNDIAPIGLVLAILMTGNQLYSLSEIYILRNAGLSPIKIAAPFLALGLVTGLVMTVNAAYLKPYVSVKLSELVFDITNANFTEYLIPGEFRYLKELGMSVTADSKQNDVLYDVFLHHEPTGQIITGQLAQIKNNGPYDYSLEIINGSTLNIEEGEATLIDFETYSAQLSRDQFAPRVSVEFDNIFQLTEREGDFPLTEFHWRLSRFLFCLSIAAIALRFIPKNPRGGTSIALLSGIIVFFIFNSVANDAYSAAAKGQLNPNFVFWWLYPSMFIAVYAIQTLFKKLRDAF